MSWSTSAYAQPSVCLFLWVQYEDLEHILEMSPRQCCHCRPVQAGAGPALALLGPRSKECRAPSSALFHC